MLGYAKKSKVNLAASWGFLLCEYSETLAHISFHPIPKLAKEIVIYILLHVNNDQKELESLGE